MKFSDLKRDTQAINEGQWVSDIPEMEPDLSLKVRGFSCWDVRDLMEYKQRVAPKADRHPDGSLKASARNRITNEVLVEKVLLDWDGVFDEGDEPQPYDQDLAAKIIQDPDHVRFGDAVSWAAVQVDQGLAEQKEGLSGN